MHASSSPETPAPAYPPRVILLSGALSDRARRLALAWAGLGQTLALIGPFGGVGGDSEADASLMELQIAIESAGGIVLAMDCDGSPEAVRDVLGRVVDALGGIDRVAVEDAGQVEALLDVMDSLPKRVRPGWVITGEVTGEEGSALLSAGRRVDWVLDGSGETDAVAREALER